MGQWIKRNGSSSSIWTPREPMPGSCLWTSALRSTPSSLLCSRTSSLNVPESTCRWITDFLTDRRQRVRGKNVLDTRTISTGAPQGCVLSPCTPTAALPATTPPSLDTTLIGLSDSNESAYRREVDRLVNWCSSNNLELNAQKTVETIVDFRKVTAPLPPLTLTDSPITTVDSFRFLGTCIT
ncbi:hypothetical protein NQD34_015929 [Periophthalmus magnuspinnatus]|nr:hypothetical protein NQD34_015929 [Periophthalmus magnuspinnatus]